MPRRRLDHVAACRPREIGVVENDLPDPRRERLVERLREVAQRAAALVAVQAVIAATRRVVRDAALSGSGNAHHDRPRRPSRRAGREQASGNAERSVERLPVGGLQREARRAGGGARGLGPSCARDRHDHGRQLEEPGQGDLRRRRTAPRRHLGERLAAIQAAGAARPSERRVGEHRDLELGTAVDHAAAERAVVVRTQCDLHSRDRSELDRLVQLRAVDVGDAHASNEAIVDEPGERAHGRPPGCPRIGCVDEVEVDREAVERGEAGLAVGADRLGAAVGNPGAVPPAHAALRHDPGARLDRRAAQGLGEERLVVPV